MLVKLKEEYISVHINTGTIRKPFGAFHKDCWRELIEQNKVLRRTNSKKIKTQIL
jgi:desulfoferrodoxin (superoxide reductase-like protein)